MEPGARGRGPGLGSAGSTVALVGPSPEGERRSFA